MNAENRQSDLFNLNNKTEQVIGLGIDILEVARIENIIKKGDNNFINRVFTPGEIEYCESKKDFAESFAVRFSAKEAFIKAVESDYNIPYRDIEVIKKESKKPAIVLSGLAQKAAEEKKVSEIMLSLSHEKNYVVANIILKGVHIDSIKS
ncbi:MAG: holo-ACP synthase [Halanaerobiales bacterium]|nr:holo-ACP synthase [Halanaerobiales bacterium]